MDQPGKVANPARGQLNRENNIPLSPCVPENLVSRDRRGRPLPRQPAHLHTRGIPPDFRGGVHLFILNRHTPSGQSRVYRVRQLRADGVPCRESAGTGPVVLKVVHVTGAAILQVIMDQLMCASVTYGWSHI